MAIKARSSAAILEAKVHSGGLEIGTIIGISGDREVSKSGPDSMPIGWITRAAPEAGMSIRIETRLKSRIHIRADGPISAGSIVKISRDDERGRERVKVWNEKTDSVTTMFGVCWFGGGGGDELEILTF